MLLVLVMLTALDGSPVWIETAQVQMIRPSIAQCHAAHGAAVRVGGVALCVKETPGEIADKVRAPKETR